MILQGIFIMTVVIVYQVARRWVARRQLQVEAAAGMDDGDASAGADLDLATEEA